MKLIVTGASGFVATDVLRQALLRDDITDIVAVARQPVSTPSGITAEQGEKLDNVVVEDYGTYGEAVKRKFENADAVIWTVAITPSKARSLPVDEVKKVCQDWTIAGFQAILEANRNAGRKVKFIYVSGTAASDPAHPHEKDTQAWMPAHMRDYARMRGETATKLFAMAKENEKNIEICIAKPGFITGGQRRLARRVFSSALWVTGLVETIDVEEVGAALLEGAVHGFEGSHGVLTNSELMDRARTRTQS